jgi:hypothetical protein
VLDWLGEGVRGGKMEKGEKGEERQGKEVKKWR